MPLKLLLQKTLWLKFLNLYAAPRECYLPPLLILQINDKIKEDVTVKMHLLPRADAVAKFGESIYDKRRPPESVTELNLLEVEGWNVAAVVGTACFCVEPSALMCAGDKCLPKTGELKEIEFMRINHRPKKQELEFAVMVGGNKATYTQKKKTAAKPKKAAPAAPKIPTTPEMCAAFLDKVVASAIANGMTEESAIAMRESLSADATITFRSLENLSFARGMKSARAMK